MKIVSHIESSLTQLNWTLFDATHLVAFAVGGEPQLRFNSIQNNGNILVSGRICN